MSTAIEWTDETWNPVTGCTKVSQGCKHCYAERLWPKVSAAEAKREGLEQRRAFTDVRMHRERFTAPLAWRKPKRVFVNSMSDLFHESVTSEVLDVLFAVMALCQGRHTFQILTKRPERMRAYFGERPNSPVNGLRLRIARRFSELARNDDVSGFELPLPNVWLGVSVEDQATAEERIPLLLRTPAAVRFISAEPLLGPVDLTGAAAKQFRKEALAAGVVVPILDWVIAGGESGPNARPSHPQWFASLRDQCEEARVAFFFKQWGEWAPTSIARVQDQWGKDDVLVKLDGSTHTITHDDHERYDASDVPMLRIGKKAAGRLLDGRTHDEYPA